MKEALEIQELARKYKILVLANYGSTWQAGQYAAKAAVDAGEIGPVWRLHGMQGSGGPGDPKKSSFAAWLADPVQNGAGALMDFGCYLVVWSVGLKGMPESVYATVQHMKPETYPNVDDNATIILNYKDGLAILDELGLSAGAAPGQRNLRHKRQHRRQQHSQAGCSGSRRRRTRNAARRSAERHSAAARTLRTHRLHGGPDPQQATTGRLWSAKTTPLENQHNTGKRQRC